MFSSPRRSHGSLSSPLLRRQHRRQRQKQRCRCPPLTATTPLSSRCSETAPMSSVQGLLYSEDLGYFALLLPQRMKRRKTENCGAAVGLRFTLLYTTTAVLAWLQGCKASVQRTDPPLLLSLQQERWTDITRSIPRPAPRPCEKDC